MLDKVVNMLKQSAISIPGFIFFNIGKLGIDYEEFYYLSYILNLSDLKFNIENMSKDLNVNHKDILKVINNLDDKNLLKLEIDKKLGTEYFNLDSLYKKIALLSIENVPDQTTLFDEFERVFKRPLTPREFQIINAWKESGYIDDIILLALKETEFNQVYNIAYTDKILSAWDKKGIKTIEDFESNREDFNRKKQNIEEVVGFDWLNENE